MKIYKYPRTRHIEGSRLQLGDSADDKPFAELKGKRLIIEEKVDGANCAISFPDGVLRLQSRGHYLTRLTITALNNLMFNPGLLHGVHCTWSAQTFNGGDF